MPQTLSRYYRALRLIVLLNISCLLLVAGMAWLSYRKAAETAATRAACQPLEARVRDLIETERDIEKLRSIARIQNIGASGSMEAVLSISNKSAASVLPGMIITMATVLVAGVSFRKPGRPAGIA